jgi:ubiquitin-like domain-containing CTD phosphatase 1
MMMGSLEEDIAVASAPPEDIPDVVNDFDIEDEDVAIESKEVCPFYKYVCPVVYLIVH